MAAAYAVLAWLLSQVAVTMETALGLPDVFDAVIVSTILIGFPVALILAWAFELTPQGVVRTPSLEEAADDPSEAEMRTRNRRRTGRRLMGVIAAGLVLALAWVAVAPVITGAPGDRVAQDGTTDDGRAQDDGSAHDALAASGPSDVSTIAVLPLADYSPEQDQAYLANGIAEQLLGVLSRIKGLQVSSRTSSFALAAREASMSEIGDALGVAHVLDGSVRKQGGQLRISAALVDTATDSQVWSETYERPLTADNIFDIQDDITAAIVTELRGRLDIDTRGRTALRTRSVEAYELYLRAVDKAQTRTPDSLQAAITMFEEVIRMEPDFAPAHAGLADAYLLTFTYGGAYQSRARDLARPHVERALELAPDLPEALVAAGDMERNAGNYEEALDYIERAIAANPNFAYAHQRHAGTLLRLSRPEEAQAATERAVALDPLSPILLSAQASTQFRSGDFDAALATAAKNLRWNPDRPYGHFMRGLISWVTGRLPDAHADLQRAYARSPKSVVIRGNLSGLYLDVGLLEQGRAMAGGENGQALFEAVAGDPAIARAIADTLNPSEAAVIYFQLRDWAGAAPGIDPLVNSLSGGGTVDLDGAYLAAQAITVADVLDRKEDAAIIARGLRGFLADRDIDALGNAVTLYAAVALALHDGDPDRALALIDRAHALNIPLFQLAREPVFDRLRDHPGLASRLARQEEIAAAHRQAIEAQLRAPEEGWLVTD